MSLFGTGGLFGKLDPVGKAITDIGGDPLHLYHGDPSAPAQQAESQLATYLQGKAAPLLKAGTTGKLTADQTAAIQTFKQQAGTQSRFQLARMGMSKSTTAVEAANQIDAESKQLANNFLSTDLQEGLAYLGAAEGDFSQLATAKMAADAAMGEALGSASAAVGQILGQYQPQQDALHPSSTASINTAMSDQPGTMYA